MRTGAVAVTVGNRVGGSRFVPARGSLREFQTGANGPGNQGVEDLARATCHSADVCAAILQSPREPYQILSVEQIREDRRLILVDLVRCLLLRGVPVPEVRSLVTEVLGRVNPEADEEVLRLDLAIAERKLGSWHSATLLPALRSARQR